MNSNINITTKCIYRQDFITNKIKLDIEYGIHQTPVGNCLVAKSQMGICYLRFLENNYSENNTTEIIQKIWNNATITKNQNSTKIFIDIIFNSREKHTIKLLLYGTEFQIKVWKALLKIPFGELTSYKNIAQKINNPLSIRAVGNAIAQNNIAILIPCHRVIKSSGNIGGYRWGENIKKILISMERTKN